MTMRTTLTGLSMVMLTSLACGGGSEPAPAAASQEDAAAFRERIAFQLTAAGESSVVEGTDGWLFFGPELRHLLAGRFWEPPESEPLPAILDFKRQLDERGIGLLVVPVPAKAVVYPEKLGFTAPAGRFDVDDAAFLDVLRSEGVEVLDLASIFTEHAEGPDGPLYCRQDTHWSGPGVVLGAERIADRIREADWYSTMPRGTYESEWRTTEITGDLARLRNGEDPPREEIRLRYVGTRGPSGLDPVAPDDGSPIVLLGDSHGLVFHAGDDMHARGAGLADQLALELGFPVDLIAVRGSGATPARFNLLRKARRLDGYWDRKRFVVWVFAVREFTQSDGWRLVPVL